MTPTIEVREPIGYKGMTAQKFADKLKELEGASEITILVNSPGGSIYEANSIYAQMIRHPARFVAEVEGLAASAASYLILAANQVRLHEFGQIMVHLGSVGMVGNREELRQMADHLERLDSGIAGMYAARSGGSAHDWLSLMKSETYLTSTEAKSLGLADEIIPGFRPGTPSKVPASARAPRSVAAAAAIRNLQARTRRRPAPGVDAYLMKLAARAQAVSLSEFASVRAANLARVKADGAEHLLPEC